MEIGLILWYPRIDDGMDEKFSISFADLYRNFNSPIAALDCGDRCAPYNEWGVPFCCDTRHAVPSAYQAEWDYLKANTDLWHLWEGASPAEVARLRKQAPEGQVLIACLGYSLCQRNYRSLVCRAFPFFPYITQQGEFIGLTYYLEYVDRCWVISHLEKVSLDYRTEFVAAFDLLFQQMPADREDFRHFSAMMRRIYRRRKRAIPLLHRNGQAYKISPRNEVLRKVLVEKLPKFSPYKRTAGLLFPDEAQD